MEQKVKFDISTVTILKVAAVVLGIWLLFAVRNIVFLFFIVLVVVAALGPLVDRMTKYIPRLLAVIILSIVVLGILAAVGFLIVPPVVTEVKQLAINLPSIAIKLGPLYQHIQNSLGNYQQGLFNVSSQIGKISSGLYSTTVGFITGLLGFLTILVLSFYMLLEQNAIKNFLNQSIPSEKKEKIIPILKKISEKMGSWLRSQFVLMFIIGALDFIALISLGVPYALALALWGGLIEVVPYIGPWLGLIPAVAISFSLSPLKGILVLIAFVIIQQIESNFLAPKIMGKAVGLSPVIIILALLVGAELMGLLGIIIAVPVAAALSVLIQEWPEIRKLYS
ncbi:MAG: AI-2E family transporter [Patescibacteria group bacterium]|jgi:predicted PurR-regulated permease PerM